MPPESWRLNRRNGPSPLFQGGCNRWLVCGNRSLAFVTHPATFLSRLKENLHHSLQQSCSRREQPKWGCDRGMDKNKQLTYGLGGLGVLLGGLGVFLISEKGREIVGSLTRHLERAPESIEQLANATQAELERIQQTLNQIAERLEPLS